MLVLCGIPFFFMEIVMGQFSSTDCIGISRMAPLLKVLDMRFLLLTSSAPATTPLLLPIPSCSIFTASLPWMHCNNSWNTDHCMEVLDFTDKNLTYTKGFKTPSDECFHLEILTISESTVDLGGIVWQIFYGLQLCWISVYVCNIKGIKSVGKVVYFTPNFPFLILLVLFLRGITLPGSMKGIVFYIKFEWSRLLDFLKV